jgi:hypothetical protein
MRIALALAVVLALALSLSGQNDSFGNLSERARVVVLTMMGEAQQRGAGVLDVNDLIVALIIEDQTPNALFLFHEPPLGTVFSTGPKRPSTMKHKPFLPSSVAVDVLVKINAILPRSSSLPHTTQMQTSAALERVLNAAQQMPAQFNQSDVQIISGTPNHPLGRYQAVVPLDLLAAALREPCEATKMLQEAGITEEKVLQTIRAGGDLETGRSPQAE